MDRPILFQPQVAADKKTLARTKGSSAKAFCRSTRANPRAPFILGNTGKARMRGPAGHHLPGVAPMNSSPDEGGGVVFGGAAYAILGMDYEIGLSLALGRMGGRR